MNLRDLEYLVALADHRHFGRAARAVGVSQPTLSTQVRKLETNLGIALIERSSRTVLLTPAGSRVVAQARLALQAAKDITEIAAAAADPRQGTVRIGLIPTLGPYLLPHVLGPLGRALPELEVLLVEDKTEELLDQVHSGALDAAVLALPVEPEGLHVLPLFDEDLVLAVPGGHRLARGDGPVGIEDIRAEPLLLLADGHCLHAQTLDVCGLGDAHVRDGFRATSLETLRHMVAAGVGATLLPRLSMSAPVQNPAGLVVREITPARPRRSIAMVRRGTSVLAALLDDVGALVASIPAGLVHPPAPAVPQ